MEKKIKVVIVDDATFMRKTICKILEAHAEFEVIGMAKDGKEAVQMNRELKPDVMTLDIDMPVMDGIRALKHMMIERPLPIVVLSSLSYEAEVTFEAFRLGVIDFIPKPAGAISTALETQEQYLCDILRNACRVDVSKLHRTMLQAGKPKTATTRPPAQKIVIVGSSLGGPNALIRILSRLPHDIPFAIIAVTHMAGKVMDSFAQKLDAICQIHIVRSKGLTPICNGESHMYTLEEIPLMQKLDAQHYVIEYQSANALAFPLDKIMKNAVQIAHKEVAGILLTGVGRDGWEGFVQIHKESGKTIVQNSENALYPEKPESIIREGMYRQLLDDWQISEQLVAMMES